MRRFHFSLLALLLSLAAQPLLAATYYVGNCNAGSYGTIQAAVNAVPPGSTINVCPGTYPEQVVISKALTLQGMNINNSSQAVISMPSGGLTTTSEIYFGEVAAQVEITGGTVNITNITVDGTAGSSNCPAYDFYIGIYYNSGSSGTVNGVEARNQNCLNGMGIMAENGAGDAIHPVKIQNSNIHDYTYSGIFICSNQAPTTLAATITGNYIASGGTYGVFVGCNAGGVISGNTVDGVYLGVLLRSSSATVSGNTVTGGSIGIDIQAPSTVASNRISNTTSYAILVEANGASIKANTITKANLGVVMNCRTSTVTGNTIIGATTGLDYVPSSFTGVNKFYDVATVRIREGCL